MRIMRPSVAALALAGFAVMSIVTGCGGSGGTGDVGGPVNLNSDTAKASYAIGVNLGSSFKDEYIEVDPQVLARGIADVLADNELQMTDEELMMALNNLQARAMERMNEASEEALRKVSAFLAENAEKDGVTTLPDSLQYEVLTEGSGPMPSPGDTVRVHYTGTFLDGSQFDSSVERGEPIEFVVASGQLIAGWDEAIQLMQVGSKWRIYLPPHLAYGPNGRPGIPPNSLLIFEMELLEINEPAEG